MAPESKELKPAICVIGAGPGGLAVASAAASRDVPTVLIEKGRMGGESLNRGSVPAQALIAAAEHVTALRNSERFGIKTWRISVDFDAVNANIRDVVDTLAPNAARERMIGLGAEVIKGTARFTDPHTVTVGDVTVKARRFVIATGSIPIVPAIPGLFHTPHLTEETVFSLAEIPRHLVVIGAGAAGLELAQAFRRFGADVTVLEAAKPLQDDDAEGAAVVLDALACEGVVMRCGVEIRQSAPRAGERAGRYVAADDAEQQLRRSTASHLLVAAGRQPNWRTSISTPPASATSRTASCVDSRCAPPTRRLCHRRRRRRAANEPSCAPSSRPGHPQRAVPHAGRCRPRYQCRSVTYTDPELAQVG